MAEAHPVGFRWVMKAKERGARVIHVDPRFGRTSQLADRHVAIRAGSDIAFLGALIRHVLESELVLQGVRPQLHQRGDDRQRAVQRHRGSRRPLLRLRQRDRPLRPHLLGVRGRRGRGGRGRARALDAGVRGQERRRHDGGGDQTRPDAPASALRLPAAQAPLRALHAGDGRAGLRRLAGGVSATSPTRSSPTPAASARPPSATPSAGRSTPPACR